MEQETAALQNEISQHYRAEYAAQARPVDTRLTRALMDAGIVLSLSGLVVCVGLPAFGVVLMPAIVTVAALATGIGYGLVHLSDKMRKSKGLKRAEQCLQDDMHNGALLSRFKKEVLAPEATALRARFENIEKLSPSFKDSAENTIAAGIPAVAPAAKQENQP